MIFIDDREDNLLSVQSALQQLGLAIEFEGLLFTGAMNYPSQEITAEQFEMRWQELVKQAVHAL